MDKLDQLLERWVEEKRIPGGVVDISVGDRFRYRKAVGWYHDGSGRRPMQLSTMFDAASLTKVTSTLPSVLSLVADGRLGLDDPVARYLPAFGSPEVTIRHLLAHHSGLPADLTGHKNREGGRDIAGEVMSLSLLSPPGTEVRYSDPGFILLGWIVEKLTGERLDAYAKRVVFEPAGMTDSTFNPPAALRPRIAATEAYKDGFIHGEVHDEKAFLLGGVCGSAGLFTTADDLFRYTRRWLYPDRYPLLTPELVRESTRTQAPTRGLGWQVWAGEEDGLSCGPLWPHGSFGHTGFTGTSVWIAPEQELTVIFLTSGVHFGRSNPVRFLRPELHSLIYTSLFGE
ncbi:esterase [Paenibacillus sp. J31TS4]|uniref:serine hydrolase domain-containing protein n=1 Tax=Paenibacillus sp. J31TS4 TaxID=2807195 RepID=UPI001B2E3041|nr:serine hydrolase domain-containing protein [Paenibacillus sp. J31TS4]GIP40364.1 esterase [Paenibacillus sp. J31TS4]